MRVLLIASLLLTASCRRTENSAPTSRASITNIAPINNPQGNAPNLAEITVSEVRVTQGDQAAITNMIMSNREVMRAFETLTNEPAPLKLGSSQRITDTDKLKIASRLQTRRLLKPSQSWYLLDLHNSLVVLVPATLDGSPARLYFIRVAGKDWMTLAEVHEGPPS